MITRKITYKLNVSFIIFETYFNAITKLFYSWLLDQKMPLCWMSHLYFPTRETKSIDKNGKNRRIKRTSKWLDEKWASIQFVKEWTNANTLVKVVQFICWLYFSFWNGLIYEQSEMTIFLCSVCNLFLFY